MSHRFCFKWSQNKVIYKNIRSLKFNNNKILDQGFLFLIDFFVKNMPNLQKLSLLQNQLSEEDVNFMLT